MCGREESRGLTCSFDPGGSNNRVYFYLYWSWAKVGCGLVKGWARDVWFMNKRVGVGL